MLYLKNKLVAFLVLVTLVGTFGVLAASAPASAAAPPVPAGDVCRVFDYVNGGLAAEDHRIGMVLNQYQTVVSFSGLSLNYLYAQDGERLEYGLNDVVSGKLTSRGVSFNYVKACAPDPGTPVGPFPSRSAFVTQQYLDFKCRTPSSSELSLWVTAMANGTGEGTVLNWFVNDQKDQRGPVVRLYKVYFLRWPEAGGYCYWASQMKAGLPLGAISDYFAGSDEFKARYGKLDNKQFVTLVYNNVLQRTPDAGGYSYWVGMLNAGRISRGGMMIGFSESPENKSRNGWACELQGVALPMLRRALTDAELAATNPDMGPTDLAYPFIFVSDEYARRFK